MRRPRYIAVIEDRAEDRFFLSHILQDVSPDCQIFEFPYAEDALHFLREPDRPRLDLLLVDISMPRMNGFQFADAYRELYPELRGNALFYLMSSSIDPHDRQLAMEHPSIDGFLEKPPSAEVLAQLLRVRDPDRILSGGSEASRG